MARTRYRDVDGRLREVTASGSSRSGAAAELKERLTSRVGFGSRLIRMGLTGSGGADLRFEAAGLRARFSAPFAQVSQG